MFIIYSVPVLKKFMIDKYYDHHLLLVNSLTKLFASGPMKWSELDEVERNQAQYVMNFEILYGRQFITLNIHNLLHISECMTSHGPFHLYSCFPYENSATSILAATFDGVTISRS